MMKMGDPADFFSQTSLHKPMLEHTWYLSRNSTVGIPECVRALNLPNALASTSFTSLDHDRPANLFSFRQTLLDSLDASCIIRFLGYHHVALFGQYSVCDAGARPSHGRNLGTLCDDGARDFVAKTPHRAPRRTDEDDFVLASS
jgi:hypothetical protein